MAAGILLAQKTDKAAPQHKMSAMRQMANPMQKCMEEMKLTEAQMTKFAEHKTTFERQKNTLDAELKNLRLDVMAAMKAENIKRVKELNKQISDKQLALMNAKVDLMANHLKELNKEQKEIMLKNMPMMMGQDRAHKMGMAERMQGRAMQRRAPGMGERGHDCDDCDDCDGVRKYKNRK
jgi:uncharacterized protein YbcC (UPF0753/DUF2309 family)